MFHAELPFPRLEVTLESPDAPTDLMENFLDSQKGRKVGIHEIMETGSSRPQAGVLVEKKKVREQLLCFAFSRGRVSPD